MKKLILIFLSICLFLNFLFFIFFFIYFINGIKFFIITGTFASYIYHIFGLIFSIAILVLLSLSIYYLMKSDLPELKEKLSDLINNSKEKRKQAKLLKAQTKLEKIQNQINDMENEQKDDTAKRP